LGPELVRFLHSYLIIGVTPFASILKSIQHRAARPAGLGKLRKVYFYWVCRDTQNFEWFQSYLIAIENDPALRDLIEIQCYLTSRATTASIAHNIFLNDDHQDAVTGLRARTKFGRPRWDDEFDGIRLRHGGQIGVFSCGPDALTSELARHCRRNTDMTTEFLFFPESF
jgi:NADPH oxidase